MNPQTNNAKAQKADPKRPWLNDPIVGQAPAQTQAKPWANDPIVQPAQPTQAGKPPPGMVADPLSKSGFAPAPKPQQDPIVPLSQRSSGYKATLETAPKPQPWNEGVADFFQKGADFLLEPLTSRNRGLDMAPENDLPGELAKSFASGAVNLPAALARDPAKTIAYDYNPIYQAGMGYKSLEDAGGDAIEGNFGTAGQKALQGVNELAAGVLGLTPFKGKPAGTPLRSTTLAEAKREAAQSSVPRNALAPEPTVREAGKTLAAVAVPGRKIRPQALDAIERILVASNVPRDRVASGLARIVEGLKSPMDGKSGRPPSISMLLKREFRNEFPEVATNLDLVRLERRLSRKSGDASPTIIREAVKDVRGTQASFLTESATRNLGATTRNATRKDMEAALSEFGEEGYQPIVSQRAEPQRARQIQDILKGPGMSELGRPLRQIAAGKGVDIDVMIAQRPIEAAHWMQHKARLLSEENAGTTLGTAYDDMRKRILATIDDLKTPDGQTYKELRTDYAETAQIGKSLKAGDQFGALVRNPEKATTFIENFKAATPAQQQAQLSSIGDWALSKLRVGGEEANARMAELQSAGVLDTLDKLGEQGKALADDIRAIRDEEFDLGAFYPKSESATASNAVALAQGADVYSRPGASSLPVNALADAALMGSGLAAAPIMTAMRQGPKLYRGIMQPRTATREDMTRVLMSRPKPGERVLARQADNAAPVNPLNVTPPPAPSGPPMNALAPAARVEPPPLVMPEAQQIGRWEGPVPQKPQSLLAWVRGQGGIKDRNYMSGDLKSVMGRANAMPGLLNNQSGKSLDDIVSAAYEQGFDVDPNDANSLMRLIEEEAAGNPSYRIGAREEYDIYQEYLAARRGDLSETPDSQGARGNPEAIGAAGGTAIGMATAPDQNGDGVVDAQERMMGGAGGALTGGIVGRGVRGGMNALAPKPSAPIVKPPTNWPPKPMADPPAPGKIRAYHGSKHEFDQFALTDETVGSGEGTQSRGYGLYFAERPNLANFYRSIGQNSGSPEDFAGSLLYHEGGDVEKVRAFLKGEIKKAGRTDPTQYKRALDALNKGRATDMAGKQGAFYEVDLDAQADDLFDLDAPLSGQTEIVQSRVADAWRKMKGDAPLDPQTSGYDILMAMGNDKAASEALSANGIKGAQFLDRASREAKSGTRNYVMFDPKNVDVRNKQTPP